MKFFILFSLFLSFSCHAGVWYYGSGEAVNLENVMGFQNAPAKIEVDGYYVYRRDLNGALVQFGSNNPELGELMKYPSFEESTAEVTVTNATKALVANNFHGTQALQCTGTGASARCCVVVDVPAQRELIRHEVSCNLKTADTGVEFTLINNGVDRGFYEVVSNNEWTAYSFLADATDSIGFCIDQADTDVTLVDNCSITSNLSKRAAVDCANELDCENEFSAKVSAAGVVSDENLDWVNGNCVKSGTNNFLATCTFNSGIFSLPPNCTASSQVGSRVTSITSTSSTQVLIATFDSNTGSESSHPFIFSCSKQGSDYKTIPNRGVINVNMDAQNDTDWKAYTPTFQGFGTPTDVSCFFKKNGANADISCAFVGGTPTGVEARVGLPSGLAIDSSIPSGNFSIGRATRFAGGSAYEKNLAVLALAGHTYVGFSSIDQTNTGNPSVRMLDTQFLGLGQGLSFNFSVPIQGWTARQEIVADLGFENIYQREETISLTGSGDFTGGSIKVSRVGDIVNISAISEITHSSSSSPESATGIIPSWAKPQTTKGNLFEIDTVATRFIVRDNGAVGFLYATFGSGSTKTTGGDRANITYSVADNISSPAMIRSCIGTECENVFSAKVSATGVISDASPIPWLTCTNTAGVATCTYESGLVTSPMNCTAIVAENSQNVFAMPTLSATGFVFQNNSVGTSRPFSVQCIKTGSDYKRSRTIVETTLEVPAIPYVSGGAELETGNTWDGEPIFRRCYEVASDITTSTTIATIPSGLNPVNSRNLSGDLWFIDNVTETATAYAWLYYNRTTGAIIGQGFGGYKIGAGSRFCLEYFK